MRPTEMTCYRADSHDTWMKHLIRDWEVSYDEDKIAVGPHPTLFRKFARNTQGADRGACWTSETSGRLLSKARNDFIERAQEIATKNGGKFQGAIYQNVERIRSFRSNGEYDVCEDPNDDQAHANLVRYAQFPRNNGDPDIEELEELEELFYFAAASSDDLESVLINW